MKTTRKLLAVLAAAMLLITLLPTALAADPTYTITINNSAADHTYEAYQVFTGDYSSGKLSNIVWGSGITDAGKTALENEYDTAATKSADGVAKALTNENVVAFAKKAATYLTDVKTPSTKDADAYKISGLQPGYYLVKDVAGSLAGKDDAYTAFILKVAGDVSVTPKSAKPTVDKKVKDEAGDAESGATEGWGETADHAINEPFQFKLTANLPVDTDFGSYETYKVVFTDSMSNGVTFDSIASVSVDGQTLAADGYTCTATAGQTGGSWTLTINDIKSVTGVNLTDGADIIVIYNAHLNENAQVNHESGATTNKNDVYLSYSNNPNASGVGHTEMGQTPVDTVWVFTYEVDNTKVDASDPSNKTPLAGAGFKLYDSTGTTEIGLIYDATISAYRPIKSGETPVEMTSADSTGVFNIKGLDAGTYILKETTVPAGYNKCADYTVVISATHAEDPSGSSATTTLNSGSNVTNTIENKQGNTLPETGGIGTTVFYVLGSILVIGAVVLLVSKKRMNAIE